MTLTPREHCATSTRTSTRFGGSCSSWTLSPSPIQMQIRIRRRLRGGRPPPGGSRRHPPKRRRSRSGLSRRRRRRWRPSCAQLRRHRPNSPTCVRGTEEAAAALLRRHCVGLLHRRRRKRLHCLPSGRRQVRRRRAKPSRQSTRPLPHLRGLHSARSTTPLAGTWSPLGRGPSTPSASALGVAIRLRRSRRPEVAQCLRLITGTLRIRLAPLSGESLRNRLMVLLGHKAFPMPPRTPLPTEALATANCPRRRICRLRRRPND